ncbi:MAG: amidase family protein [Alphaproteobacteria bacterium]|nr:amidase family protein [Alphaproteobacteria bacterium]
MAADATLIAKSAVEIIALLKRGDVSPLDLIDTLEQRIAAVEPAINALPTLCLERARDHARRLMKTKPGDRGPLAGLPIPIKDLVPVAGVRTTFGSPIFADFVPEDSESIVVRLEDRGGIVYAKSNTPEFGAGGHTFNEVFGTTANPWNPARSAGGSSGGAAAALASGCAWLAHGSDLGGSLRIPASFCGVVGLRPSPGRVPSGPDSYPYGLMAVEGPMARNVTDAALALDAMTGPDGTVPFATADSGGAFLAAARDPRKPGRIAFSLDLGLTVVDAEVEAVIRQAVARVQGAGFEVVEACPDLTGVVETFHVLRAVAYAVSNAPLLEEHRDLLKPEVIWNIEKGLALSGDAVIAAQHDQVRLFHATRAFMDTHDLLVCPATIVPPFPAEERYVTQCNGVAFESYIDWMAVAWGLTVVSLPVLAIPCGVTADGLPVGLQIAGRPGGEADLIAMARTIEDAIGDWRPQTLPEHVVG